MRCLQVKHYEGLSPSFSFFYFQDSQSFRCFLCFPDPCPHLACQGLREIFRPAFHKRGQRRLQHMLLFLRKSRDRFEDLTVSFKAGIYIGDLLILPASGQIEDGIDKLSALKRAETEVTPTPIPTPWQASQP